MCLITDQGLLTEKVKFMNEVFMSPEECLNANYQFGSLKSCLTSHNNKQLINTVKNKVQDLVPVVLGTIIDNETNTGKIVHVYVKYIRIKPLQYYCIVEQVHLSYIITLTYTKLILYKKCQSRVVYYDWYF